MSFVSPEPVQEKQCLPLWIASQRPRQHLLVQCPFDLFELVAAQAKRLAAPPIHVCLRSVLRLPSEKEGTLVLGDVSRLGLADQIALYDWLGADAERLCVIAITTAPLARLVELGGFLSALFHRLGAAHFNLTPAEGALWRR